MHNRESRGQAIARAFAIIRELEARRLFTRTTEIVHAINDRLGERYHRRTIQRDLQAMQHLGWLDSHVSDREVCWKLVEEKNSE